MEGLLAFFGAIAVLVAGAFYSFRYEWRKAEKEEQLRLLELELKLKEEKSKPKAVIKFHVKEQGILNTNPAEPTVYLDKVMTSEEVACEIVNLSYKRGYFTDDNNVTYPTCNIIKAYIKESK
jgi:hypothetical protein